MALGESIWILAVIFIVGGFVFLFRQLRYNAKPLNIILAGIGISMIGGFLSVSDKIQLGGVGEMLILILGACLIFIGLFIPDR